MCANDFSRLLTFYTSNLPASAGGGLVDLMFATTIVSHLREKVILSPILIVVRNSERCNRAEAL